jgi:hypothetical protein
MQICNSNFVGQCAFLVTGSLTVMLIFLGATMQGNFPSSVFVIGAIILMALTILILRFVIEGTYYKNIKQADVFFKKLENNESLPSLEEMIKMVK